MEMARSIMKVSFCPFKIFSTNFELPFFVVAVMLNCPFSLFTEFVQMMTAK